MSAKILLFKNKPLKTGEFAVMLYLYEDGKKHYLSLGEKCLPKHWDDVHGRFRKSADNYTVKNLNLRKYELQANEILDDFIRKGQLFNIERFKEKFFGIKKTEKMFYDFFQDIILEKRKLDKIGTMVSYKYCYNCITAYKKGNVKFEDITYTFLKGFETYLFQRGLTGGGVGLIMRSIKAVYYEGVRRGLVAKDLNPFSTVTSKDGYSFSKLKSTKNPRALSADDMEKIKHFDVANNPQLAKSYYMFMFSYYLFGINFQDVANLKKENLIENRLVYRRQKTGKLFNLKLSEEAQAIIKYFQSENDYLFPVFNATHTTALKKKYRTSKVLKQVNADLKIIGFKLGISTPITYYVGRHSAATTLKRNGLSVEVISEALGHSNSKITQWYLAGFGTDVLDSAMAKL